ncbi:mitochondrial inner membrane protease ATP23 homolog [Nomia melanderi]|uniref:mitochondrial inner membrane protease ATP23 homolog n=1 Tax=Nomia melanderi TaxID=2448451 RepID=UPI0013043FE9|nr:mitochondrial inner membrane protease ATP23 homolog [Nomia melanderi]
MSSVKEDQTQSVPNISDNIEKDNYDLYPQRRESQRSWVNKILRIEERQDVDKFKCEMNVYKCIKDSALVKLMLAALKSSGCEIDIRRHITCEVCDTSVTGGYDPDLNQVIVCQNTATSKGKVQGVLSHEMIHMFDFCRNNMNLNDINHLACTEIRAANLCHCSFLGSWIQGFASPFNIKERHQICVKDKAMKSILAVRNVTEDAAREAVNRVFEKCYNDLEPVGRRIRRNSDDMERAYAEAPLYGYFQD